MPHQYKNGYANYMRKYMRERRRRERELFNQMAKGLLILNEKLEKVLASKTSREVTQYAWTSAKTRISTRPRRD